MQCINLSKSGAIGIQLLQTFGKESTTATEVLGAAELLLLLEGVFLLAVAERAASFAQLADRNAS